MQTKIAITSIASVSPLGNETSKIWENYLNPTPCFTETTFDGQTALGAFLAADARQTIEALRQSDTKYKSLDDSVLFAITAARRAMQNAGWKKGDHFGINLGSSRGATGLFEKYFRDYLETGKTSTLSSPTTTLGNIASWVAQDLQNDGPDISHSITCSTALHALVNGVAWLRSGMADKFMVGGSEAPLTPFTIAQMRAMKIYAKENQPFPCRAMDFDKKQNTMILGEGAAICCLESGEEPNALAYVEGIGYATEVLEHNVSISAEADCFQKSMKMALQHTPLSEVDVIVMHAPGTKTGDITELRAIQKIFGENLPLLTTNKWKIGHTFGASGMLGIELAILMMRHDTFIGVPFTQVPTQSKSIKKVLINAVGFGGNAVSVLLSKA
ncbi:beta-ketoacyl synthase N-terminal-like domain-containing protein [Flavobacterium sp.]|uniref:beta-ketoacyl synthase N-terminal-like domain-containing protein n=1 Tax=Flavobacterium sp. TaxID=239 RepID=UPI0039E456A5